MVKKSSQQRPTTRKRGSSFQTNQKARKAEILRLGLNFLLLNVLSSTCGTKHIVWSRRGKPVPLTGIFVNRGICSIEVTISGRGKPQKIMIPSRGGARILMHPSAKKVAIECLENVEGGDCDVVYLLIW